MNRFIIRFCCVLSLYTAWDKLHVIWECIVLPRDKRMCMDYSGMVSLPAFPAIAYASYLVPDAHQWEPVYLEKFMLPSPKFPELVIPLALYVLSPLASAPRLASIPRAIPSTLSTLHYSLPLCSNNHISVTITASLSFTFCSQTL